MVAIRVSTEFALYRVTPRAVADVSVAGTRPVHLRRSRRIAQRRAHLRAQRRIWNRKSLSRRRDVQDNAQRRCGWRIVEGEARAHTDETSYRVEIRAPTEDA